jgi:hypothetical protein
MRITENLSDRVSGPMHLRFLLQPVVATPLAIRSGLKGAQTGKPAFFWALIFHPCDASRRREMIKDGWQSISKLFCAAITLDLIYQLIQPFIYFREAIIVACLLAIVRYLMLRGAGTRLASRLMTRRVA